MSDGPPSLRSPDLPAGADDATSRTGLLEPALAYDYFKSMVSVSLAILGRILTLGEAVFGARIAAWQMGLAALPVAISGVLALPGQDGHRAALPGHQASHEQRASGASTGSGIIRDGAWRLSAVPGDVLPRARGDEPAPLRLMA